MVKDENGNIIKDHPLYLATKDNAGVLGKLKDDMEGDYINEFVGLRAKMYSVNNASNNNRMKAKGIPSNYVSREFNHSDYIEALLNETLECKYNCDLDELLGFDSNSRKSAMTSFNTIRSKDHKLSTVNITKLGLNAYDDKRYILNDGIHTLAHGHYRITEINRGRNPQAATD